MTRHFLLCVMLLLLVVSCSGEEVPGGETKDPQLRALNAKCPPRVVCGPQDNPETLALAWLNASESGLCSVLAKYTSADRADIATDYCGATESYEIEAIVIKEMDGHIDGRPNLKEVTFEGILNFTLRGESSTRKNWSILVEKMDGKWYVIDGYH